jgi:hypothetical protein
MVDRSMQRPRESWAELMAHGARGRKASGEPSQALRSMDARRALECVDVASLPCAARTATQTESFRNRLRCCLGVRVLDHAFFWIGSQPRICMQDRPTYRPHHLPLISCSSGGWHMLLPFG